MLDAAFSFCSRRVGGNSAESGCLMCFFDNVYGSLGRVLGSIGFHCEEDDKGCEGAVGCRRRRVEQAAGRAATDATGLGAPRLLWSLFAIRICVTGRLRIHGFNSGTQKVGRSPELDVWSTW